MLIHKCTNNVNKLNIYEIEIVDNVSHISFHMKIFFVHITIYQLYPDSEFIKSEAEALSQR